MKSPNEVWYNSQLRTALSIFTATLATLICVYQQHFTLSLSDPGSFLRATTHRCADTLLASSLWMTFEVLHLCYLARQRHLFGLRWAAYEAAREA